MDAGRICPEDVVCLVSDPCMPGMVCCVGEDTENRHAQPSAHVYWLRENDNDRMEPISELRILDRALLHGDTGVRSGGFISEFKCLTGHMIIVLYSIKARGDVLLRKK